MVNTISDLVQFNDDSYFIVFNYETKVFRVWFSESDDELCLQEAILGDDGYIDDFADIGLYHNKVELMNAIRQNL